jgi:hypothetical protein
MLFILWFFVGLGVWFGLTASKLADFSALSVDQKVARFVATVALWPGALWNRADLDYVRVKQFLSDVFS